MKSDNVGIKVEMICECGNIVEPESSGYGNGSIKGTIILYDHVIYICTKCGGEMSRRIVKTVTTETETVL